MENFFLIYLLSFIVGTIGTYYLIKTAVKNGVEADNNKLKEPVGEPVKEEIKEESLTRDILIGLGILSVVFFLYISGMLA